MGFNIGKVPWSELEATLSGRPAVEGDGGDSPGWSRKRAPYEPPSEPPRPPAGPPYAELHCHSNFSFLDGASHPEDLAAEAARLGLTALAVTDHDGMYGVVRFAEAARAHGLATVFGAELSLGLSGPQNGEADPEGDHLLVLARNAEGYHRLCAAISAAHRRGGQKGQPVYDLDELAAAHGGHWVVLTGCRKGAVRRALDTAGPDAARDAALDLVDLFGAENVVVELIDHLDPSDSERNDALAALAAGLGLPTVATNNVHYARPADGRMATALAAVRARRSMDDLDGWLPPASTAHLRSGAEQTRFFARYPGAVARAAQLGAELAFDLRLVVPRLPDCEVPDGHTDMSWLRHLTLEGARHRYGPREAPRVAGAYPQLEHELVLIEQLGFAGYFLIVKEIVEFCRRSDILCQGRGSAANSAVCFALGITVVDAVKYKLLFERFLAPERDGPPDIDLDIESGRREEVIQHVYAKYGRDRAAQVANVITYRPRSAVRDIAKAFGFAQGQQDAWSKQLDGWSSVIGAEAAELGIPEQVVAMTNELIGSPRHLGIHSGGMVLCHRPVTEVVPVEWGRMPGRTVLQWDKDDCAATGLVKFDLLGLGMLSAIHYAIDFIAEHHGVHVDLAQLPLDDPAVYDMLCKADTVGVFQIESRAQMATLPRLKPREFYDLVVEVALIRPGPIQGGSVHPYIRRRNGLEKPTYLHPILENSLRKTLGVPLFQEQLMQMAIDIGGFTPAQADELRRAMGSKRSIEKMERLKEQLFAGMASNGLTGSAAETTWLQLQAFANYGFPESHAISFAVLVYASSWLKRYYPGAFCAALLKAQPMGFYSPQSLVADARRHGVITRGPDINASAAKATLEPVDPAADAGAASPVPALTSIPLTGTPPELSHAVRLGLAAVRTIGEDLADRIGAERDTHGPYRDMTDLAGRVELTTPQVENLASAGAFACFDLERRAALWAAGAVAQSGPGRLAGVVTGTEAPPLPGMSKVEIAVADVATTGISPGTYPIEFLRRRLDELGAVPIGHLDEIADRSRVLVGGAITHRQRPATAGGVTFMNLEDETGMLNVIVSPGCFQRFRKVAKLSAALLIRGQLERADGVTSLVAEHLEQLPLTVQSTSRDFR